ncbi:hypothetical protein [Legionella brunensis]|uniref:Uncharacterized protein n=1 Tax=Legionella brunensis TaxID=29422 RepID=A0A0W0SUL5_9GAMM|nr:hypothetical protein [Legionella brunensis]KTC87086.1 hypothetical protein Lbru_0315 [Legionella brunensis]
MNKRLIWNFEINDQPQLVLDSLPQGEKESIKWEARYFWPEDSIIILNGLDSSFLNLSNYEIKNRQDYYLLLSDYDYNIKQRRDELQYKPLLQEIDNIRGYGKKIDLNLYTSNSLPAALHSTIGLLSQLQEKAIKLSVSKIALLYRFQTTPAIKLELARLKVHEKIFFSVCIEGPSQLLVTQIAKYLLPDQISCDYVSFLRQLFTP